jgi:hypothetical protein
VSVRLFFPPLIRPRFDPDQWQGTDKHEFVAQRRFSGVAGENVSWENEIPSLESKTWAPYRVALGALAMPG